MLEDQLVFRHRLRTRDRLGIVEVVPVHLEDNLGRRHVEHDHHHAARARREVKALSRRIHVHEQGSVQFGLRALALANRDIEIRHWLLRQHALKKRHELARLLGLDEEM